MIGLELLRIVSLLGPVAFPTSLGTERGEEVEMRGTARSLGLFFTGPAVSIFKVYPLSISGPSPRETDNKVLELAVGIG